MFCVEDRITKLNTTMYFNINGMNDSRYNRRDPEPVKLDKYHKSENVICIEAFKFILIKTNSSYGFQDTHAQNGCNQFIEI